MNFSFYRSKSVGTPQYSLLSKDDDSTAYSSGEINCEKALEPEFHECRRSFIRQTISVRTAVIISATVAMILTLTLIPLGRFALARYGIPSPLTCGKSVEEAQAKGCVFDLLDYSWVPSVCYDAQTADEFKEWLYKPHLRHGAFPFFEDHRMKKRVAGPEALSRRIGMKTYAPQQEHEAHCVCSARRHFRAAEDLGLRRVRKPLAHNLHCLKELETALTRNSSRYNSEFGVGFSTC